MSKAIRQLVFLTLIYVGSPGIGTADHGLTITLAGDPWPPYVVGELGKEATGGFGIELMQEIFSRVDGTRLINPMVPWNRALREVRLGSKDGIGILLKTKERAEYMEYTDELFQSFNTIWYASDKFPTGFEWQHYRDLEPYSLGIISGHSYTEEIDALIANGTLSTVAVSSAAQLFAMLNKGRIDLAMTDQLVGKDFARKYAGSDRRLQATKKPVSVEAYHIGISKKSKALHLVPEINKVIAQLRDEGVIHRYLLDAGMDPVHD